MGEQDGIEVRRARAGEARAVADVWLRSRHASVPAIPAPVHTDDEVRAWTIRGGTRAREAAGAIHSDIERGFIRAEVVHCDDLIRLKTMAACKDAGIFRLEGKEYVVRDGDVTHFRFNV
jgi:ribosome-binding ATPase YchF (GTP1/OBG family)